MTLVEMGKKGTAAGVALAAALLMFGCGGQAQEAETTEPEPVEEEVTYTIVGQQVEGNAEVLTTNNLGSAITMLTLKAPNATEATANLIAAGTEIAADEQFLLCFTPVNPEAAAKTDDESKDASDAKDESSKSTSFTDETSDTTAPEATDALYELTATLADGTAYVMPGLALETYESMELVVSDGVASASYKTTDGKTGTTQQASLDAKAADEAAAAEAERQAAEQAAAEQAAAEAAAAEAAAAEAAASEYDYDYDYSYGSGSGSSGGSSYSGGSDYTYDSGAGSGSGGSASTGPSQNQDSCIDPNDIPLK